MEQENQVFDKGPWHVVSEQGKVWLSSDDFKYDVGLAVSGDFGDVAHKLAYAKHLADILTAGCARQQAALALQDDGNLLAALTRVARGADGELLHRAAEEIARLRVALAEAGQALEQLSNSAYRRSKVTKALEPSPFALALQAALDKAGQPS